MVEGGTVGVVTIGTGPAAVGLDGTEEAPGKAEARGPRPHWCRNRSFSLANASISTFCCDT